MLNPDFEEIPFVFKYIVCCVCIKNYEKRRTKKFKNFYDGSWTLRNIQNIVFFFTSDLAGIQ